MRGWHAVNTAFEGLTASSMISCGFRPLYSAYKAGMPHERDNQTVLKSRQEDL